MPKPRTTRLARNCRICVRWAVLACLALAFSAGNLLAQSPSELGLTSKDLWLEIRDAKDRAPNDLSPEDLEIQLGDQRLDVSTLVPSVDRARLVIYFDRPMSSSGTLRRAADSLQSLIKNLGALGDVEVVVADPEPVVLIDAGEPLIVGERLSRMALTEEGGEAILELRRRTLRDLTRPTLGTPLQVDEKAELVVESLREEAEQVRAHREELLAWISEQSSEKADSRPKILFLVFDGFDLQPLDFYAQHLDEATLRAVLATSTNDPNLLGLEAANLGTARTLAALGWSVFPLTLESLGKSSLRFDTMEMQDQQGGTSTGQGITFNPGSLFKRRGREEESSQPVIEIALADPVKASEPLAALTGGQFIASDQALRDAVKRLGERYVLSYQAPASSEVGLLPLEIRPKRTDLKVRSARWTSQGTPPEIARIRIRRLFSGAEPEQGFDVVAALNIADLAGDGPASGEIDVRLNLRDLEATARGQHDLRLTVAALEAGGERELLRQTFPQIDLIHTDDWPFSTTLQLTDPASQVAVLIEDLETGRWGGSIAALVQSSSVSRVTAGAPQLPAPTVIEIERPERDVLRGRVRFNTKVYDPAVSRVVFLLDDREVATSERAPWSARLDLGRVPRRRDLVAVAYNASGVEMGRHEVVVNGGRSGLAIKFVRPERNRGTGWVEVEAAVTVPLEHQLDRVLFFWNNEAIATLYSPPFIQNVFIPEDQSAGYLRAVAMLDDGTLTEDVLFMNGPESGESLDVNLVELYTVVTDRNNRPVRGLQLADFKVFEDGSLQQVSSFSDASDLPLTLGMAIDSSASMFVKMPRVQEAAIHFLESTFGTDDRAFIVDFDSAPRLARAPTQNLERLIRAIRNLEPDGRTALWESVVYSLVQLQGVRGRKALIVFSDGADEDDQFPFRTCLDLAERMGVPIYLILMRHEPKDSGNLNLFSRSFNSRVSRLMDATGGRVFNAKEYKDLGEVYAEIEQELRSQYLLAYYPKSNGGAGWRDVRIEVEGKGLTPRTLSGYWQ